MARIDTLDISKQLVSFGFSIEQAEGLPRLVLSLIDDSAATKGDVSAVRSEISAVQAQIARLESLIKESEARMIARVYGGQIAAVVATVGALKLFGVF